MITLLITTATKSSTSTATITKVKGITVKLNLQEYTGGLIENLQGMMRRMFNWPKGNTCILFTVAATNATTTISTNTIKIITKVKNINVEISGNIQGKINRIKTHSVHVGCQKDVSAISQEYTLVMNLKPTRHKINTILI